MTKGLIKIIFVGFIFFLLFGRSVGTEPTMFNPTWEDVINATFFMMGIFGAGYLFGRADSKD